MSKQSTGLVRDLIKIPEWSGNDLMLRFVRQVESSPVGTDIAPFWIKEKPGMRYRTSQASQAAIVAAYRAGMLSCSGKPGRMKFYHTDAMGFHTPFSKVNSLLKVMLTMFLFWYCLVLPLAHLNSAVADKVLWVLGIFACLAYGNRAFSYMAYKPLFLFTPGHGGNVQLTTKIGLYLISTMWSIGLMIALYMRSGDHTLELTFGELLARYPSLAWEYFVGNLGEYAKVRFVFELDFRDALRNLAFFFMPLIAGFGTGMFAAFYADGGSPAALSSTSMMERFCADPVGNRQINHSQKGFIFAAGLSVYWVLQFIVWIDISLIK